VVVEEMVSKLIARIAQGKELGITDKNRGIKSVSTRWQRVVRFVDLKLNIHANLIWTILILKPKSIKALIKPTMPDGLGNELRKN